MTRRRRTLRGEPLTPAMKFVVDKMRQGYELGCTSGHTWLQKGKIGHSGESITVNANTFLGIYRRGLIKQIRKLSYGGSANILSKRGLSIDAKG